MDNKKQGPKTAQEIFNDLPLILKENFKIDKDDKEFLVNKHGDITTITSFLENMPREYERLQKLEKKYNKLNIANQMANLIPDPFDVRTPVQKQKLSNKDIKKLKAMEKYYREQKKIGGLLGLTGIYVGFKGYSDIKRAEQELKTYLDETNKGNAFSSLKDYKDVEFSPEAGRILKDAYGSNKMYIYDNKTNQIIPSEKYKKFLNKEKEVLKFFGLEEKREQKQKGGLLDDDRTRAKQLVDRVASSPQKFESRIREMNYYKELRDEEFLRDKEAGMSFRELQKLYGDLNTYIKRKKEEEAMEDLPPIMTMKRTKDKPAKKTMKGGGLLDDDRENYIFGGISSALSRVFNKKLPKPKIKKSKSKPTQKELEDELRQLEYEMQELMEDNYYRPEGLVGQRLDAAEEIQDLSNDIIKDLKRYYPDSKLLKEIERADKAEGGPMSMDNQMQMAMNKSEEPMESDDVMEDNYTKFIMEEALTEEEETMLTFKLEQDEELAMLFDKVIDVAQEFAGSGPVEGPGSGVSDSIPARLSDGEFVFTAKATEQIGADELMRMMKDAEAQADKRQPAQMGGVMDKDNPNPLGMQGSILDNREDDYTNPIEQPPIRGAGYRR